MAVENGNKIKVEYVGTLEDGTEFDSTAKHGGEPIEFEVGAGQLIKGFDEAVLGMEKGEEKEITLQPADAYGEPKPEMIKKVPKEQLPPGQEVKPGMMMAIGTPDGKQFPAKIVEVTDTEIALDLNHPLAGKVLKFKIKVVDF
jgi:FKBP-type peptidyl-prolyl cis-trans isomerase 2